jgi:murein DD-endopeptidase MepM/ murein hydrolase activator NlpD
VRRRRTLATVTAVVAASVAVAFAPTSGAQDTTTTTSSTSSTTTTIATATTEPTSTVPGTTTPVTDPGSTVTTGPPATVPGIVVPPIDPSIPIPPEDIIPHDDASDPTPTGAAAPPGPWDGVGITNPRLAGLKAELDLSQNRLVAAQTAVTNAEAALTAATAARTATEGAHSDAAAKYSATRERFTRRVAASYIAAGDPNVRLRPQHNISREADRVVLPGAVTNSDRELADQYQAERDNLSDQLRGAIEAESKATITLDSARQALTAAQASATAAERQIAQTPSDLPGFVFPVAGPTSFISSFGFCRDGCRRLHQGNDLFARAGTPVVAAEDGWVEKVGVNSLGGNTVWTRGRSGYRYYYAHLRDWAPIVAGQPITAGTVVGTVGNTGNAATTPSHLHFEIHPGNASAIDPYPILVRAPRVTLTPEAAAIASGITPEAAAAAAALPPPPGG